MNYLDISNSFIILFLIISSIFFWVRYTSPLYRPGEYDISLSLPSSNGDATSEPYGVFKFDYYTMYANLDTIQKSRRNNYNLVLI